MHDYRKLRVYERSLELVEVTYSVSRGMPKTERYGLVAQLNRASVSIAANIAEGAARGDRRDFARFLRIARGSAAEVGTLAEVARRLGFAAIDDAEELKERSEQLKAGLMNLERSLRTR